jgi:hypothetical protein
VTDDLTGALADLERAEAVAVRYHLLAEQARIRPGSSSSARSCRTSATP